MLCGWVGMFETLCEKWVEVRGWVGMFGVLCGKWDGMFGMLCRLGCCVGGLRLLGYCGGSGLGCFMKGGRCSDVV